MCIWLENNSYLNYLTIPSLAIINKNQTIFTEIINNDFIVVLITVSVVYSIK